LVEIAVGDVKEIVGVLPTQTVEELLIKIATLEARASEVRQLLLYTISSKGLRISSEDDTDVSSCFLAVH